MLFTHDSDEARAHAEVSREHTAHLSHELIAAAASYEAAKVYENHVRNEGKPANHEKAIEILAALTGGIVDRMAETKGLDALDTQRAKRAAHERADKALKQSGEY